MRSPVSICSNPCRSRRLAYFFQQSLPRFSRSRGRCCGALLGDRTLDRHVGELYAAARLEHAVEPSAKTASLPGIRSITPLEMTTSKLSSGKGSCSASLAKLDVRRAHRPGALTRGRNPPRGHASRRPHCCWRHHLGRDEGVGACSGTEIEDAVAWLEQPERERLATPANDPADASGTRASNSAGAEIKRPRSAGREDELRSLLGRDPRVGLRSRTSGPRRRCRPP